VAFALSLSATAAFAQVDTAAGTPSRGEYVARAGNCVACHSTPDGAPFAGGLKMAVPMLGAIYTTNITPDRETGIGNYTFEDFDRAMRKGIAKDGHHLYPAMPYPSYAKMSDEDMHALYDFFMKEVEPAKAANKPSEIPSVLNWRWPLAVWNVLFRKDGAYEAKAEKDAAWNRGAYLVQGLGHCGACHTPRGVFFQEKALDEAGGAYLSGARLDNWSAAPLNGNVNTGLGRWSEQDISDFLKTGHNQFGTAFGTMVEVVNSSTQYLSAEDLAAIATYLKSLPAAREETPYRYQPGTQEALASMKFEDRGGVVYYQYCVSCHRYDGSGQKPHMPPLAGNPVVVDPDPVSLLNLTLNGSLRLVRSNLPEMYDMPYFRVVLNDGEIADVVNFIRNAWGNAAAPVTAEDVAKLRKKSDPTANDDVVILRMK
jgi:mono/diheme cytochrome c family protein